MTRSEALKFFQTDDVEEAEEVFEQRLFELKNYFVTKPLISKLFKTQLLKLQKINSAASSLGFLERGSENTTPEAKVIFTDIILDSYSLFEKVKAEAKLRIQRAESAPQIEITINNLLNVQAEYLKCYPEIEAGADIVVGKEPDPMDLITSIKEMEKKGISLFSELQSESNAIPVTFLNEWKRLSLLRKMEQEWKISSGS